MCLCVVVTREASHSMVKRLMALLILAVLIMSFFGCRKGVKPT